MDNHHADPEAQAPADADEPQVSADADEQSGEGNPKFSWRLYFLGLAHLMTVFVLINQTMDQESWGPGIVYLFILSTATAMTIMAINETRRYRADTERDRQDAGLTRICVIGNQTHLILGYLAFILLLEHGWDAWIMFAIVVAMATHIGLIIISETIAKDHRQLQLNANC